VIIERYLFRETATTFAGVLSVLLLVWASHRFVRYLAQAAAGSIAADLILQLLGLKLLANLGLLLPVSLYLAVLLAVGRLYRDSEVTALAAAGIGPGRLMRATVLLSLAFALPAAAVSLYLSPLAARLADEVETRAEESADYSNVLAGRFKAIAGGDRVFYAEGVSEEGQTLQGVFAQVRQGERLHTLTSATGHLWRDPASGERFLVLVDGYRYQGAPGAVDFLVTRYREHAVRIEERREDGPSRRLQGIPSTDLLTSGVLAHRAELHWRLAIPVSSVLLGALAFLMARTAPRQGRYGGLFNAVLLYFLYTNLLGIGRELLEDGQLPAAAGLWPSHVTIALLVGGIAFARSAAVQRLARRLPGRRPGLRGAGD
jgi:lipopolysaccharide export system permease protein